MTLEMYSIFDMKALVYQAPFFFVNRGVAIRAVQEALKDRESMLAKYPFDFQLVRIGEWDDEHGLITPATHEVLGVLSQFVVSAGPVEVPPLLKAMGQ